MKNTPMPDLKPILEGIFQDPEKTIKALSLAGVGIGQVRATMLGDPAHYPVFMAEMVQQMVKAINLKLQGVTVAGKDVDLKDIGAAATYLLCPPASAILTGRAIWRRLKKPSSKKDAANSESIPDLEGWGYGYMDITTREGIPKLPGWNFYMRTPYNDVAASLCQEIPNQFKEDAGILRVDNVKDKDITTFTSFYCIYRRQPIGDETPRFYTFDPVDLKVDLPEPKTDPLITLGDASLTIYLFSMIPELARAVYAQYREGLPGETT